MISRLAALSTLLTIGCATSQTGGADLQTVVLRCGLDGLIELNQIDDQYVAISSLDPQVDYDKVDCLLRGVRRLGLRLGLVGNEAAEQN